MKICTETESWMPYYTVEETFRQLSEAGFDGVDLSLCAREGKQWLDSPDYLRQAVHVRDSARAFDLPILQAHAPFGHRSDDEAGAVRVIRAIEFCGVVGAPNLVVHPCFLPDQRYDEKQREYFEHNLAYYNRLRPYAQSAGVRLALENMFEWGEKEKAVIPSVFSTAEDMLHMLRALDGPFTVCLDIGHANLNAPQSAAEMIRKLGAAHLGCLHIHDNDGVSDMHTLPFTQKLEYPPIFEALHEIGYRGCFTYEANSFLTRFPAAAYPAAARLMAVLAREWIRIYDL